MRSPRSLAIALTVVTLAACGGTDNTNTERPLTGAEAAQMAAVQYSNMQTGGATFEVASANTVTNDQVSLRGEVDWVAHTGRAVVSATGTEQSLVEVLWADNQVLERRRDVAAALPSLGLAPDTWVARPIDPANRPVDRIISILMRLSSTEPDNAVLIQQQEGSAFMREDTWRDIPVNVFRYGKQTLYWLDAASGELRRFEGNNSRFTSPVIVDIVERSKRTIVLPDDSAVVSIDRLRELYDATTP